MTFPVKKMNVTATMLRTAGRMFGARGCFLTFHRIATSDLWPRLPNRDFYVDATYLSRLLRHLQAGGWSIVTVEEALQRMAKPATMDRFVNISIDDCYRDTYEQLVPIFRAHDAPVTLFVTTGIPDGTLSMWAAGLETILLERDQVRVDGEIIDIRSTDARRSLFHRLFAAWDAGDAERNYRDFCDANDVAQARVRDANAITWDMLRDLSRDRLVEIGGHTVSHPRISQLTEAAALEELSLSRQRLVDELRIDVRHFAFPFGRRADCGPRDFRLAAKAGFASAATTRKGLARAGQNPYSLPRNTLNGRRKSLSAAELHLTGVSGLLARATGRI